MSTPPLKLLALFIRQLSRPLALTIKAIAVRNESISTLCTRTAVRVDSWNKHLEQTILNTTTHGQPQSSNHTRSDIHQLRVIDHGSMIIAETTLYVFATIVVILEWNKSRQSEINRRKEVRDDILLLQDEIENLREQLKENHLILAKYMPPTDVYPTIIQVSDRNDD